MANYRMLVYGILLVFLMVFRPNGLMGGVNFTGLLLRAIGRDISESVPHPRLRHLIKKK
jgi:hypothetical protein